MKNHVCRKESTSHPMWCTVEPTRSPLFTAGKPDRRKIWTHACTVDEGVCVRNRKKYTRVAAAAVPRSQSMSPSVRPCETNTH